MAALKAADSSKAPDATHPPSGHTRTVVLRLLNPSSPPPAARPHAAGLAQGDVVEPGLVEPGSHLAHDVARSRGDAAGAHMHHGLDLLGTAAQADLGLGPVAQLLQLLGARDLGAHRLAPLLAVVFGALRTGFARATG